MVLEKYNIAVIKVVQPAIRNTSTLEKNNMASCLLIFLGLLFSISPFLNCILKYKLMINIIPNIAETTIREVVCHVLDLNIKS